MLYLFDQDDKFLSLLVKETGLVDAWFKDYQNHIIDEPFVFKVSSDSPKLKYIEAENQVAFHDRDGKLRLMRMKQLYEETSQEGSLIRVVCEPSYLELYDHFIEDKRYVSKTAQNALDGALQGSRYVGEVTVELGLETDSFYWIDGIEAVFKILETWGGALKDTITLDADNEIIERKIWIVHRLGADNGLIVEPDFNAESIERKTLSYVETALWGQGSSLEITDDDDEHTGGYTRYITFEDVVWSKAKGDPVDKPKGQKWVGDPIALSEYGYLHNGVRKHRFGHFSNQDYETPDELLMATWLELQERKLKEIIHEATIYKADRKISLGDTVTILNRKYNKPIELQSQITGLEYDVLNADENITIIVGKYIDMNEDPLQKDVDDLKDVVHKPRPTAPITDESFPDIVPGIPVSIDAVGGIGVIQLYWDYDSRVYISHYEVYGSQIADFAPDSQQLLYRGRVSSFAHMVDTDEKWYYYIRAVNKRGTASGFSVRVEASSLRVISDDILFGSIIADHLSNNLDIADKLAQNTIDAINRGPMLEIEYTKEQITETENRLLGQLNSEIGDVNASIGNLNTVADNLKNRVDGVNSILSDQEVKVGKIENDISGVKTDLATKVDGTWVDGRLSTKADANSVYTISQIDNKFDNVVSITDYVTDKDGYIDRFLSNESRIYQTEQGLGSKVERTEYTQLVDDVGNMGSELNTAKTDISQNATQIASKASQSSVNTLTGEVSNLESTVTQQAGLIESKVDSTKYTTDMNGVTQKLTSQGTAISQNATAISAKANQSQVDNISGTVSNHTAELSLQATKLAAKLDSLEYQTDKTGIINRIESNEFDIQATAAGLDLRVTKEEFEALEIGGRNLVLKSDIPVTSTVYHVTGYNLSEDWELNTEYVITIKGNVNSGQVFGIWANGASTQVATLNNKQINGVYSIVFKTPSVINSTTTKRLNVYNVAVAGATKANIEWIQLKKGNVISYDWTPAPEDTDTAISLVRDRVTKTETDLSVQAGLISAKAERSEVYTRTVTDGLLNAKVNTTVYNNKMGQLDVSINGIDGRVSNTETEINGLTGEMTSAKSQIANLDIKANGIVQSVSEVSKNLIERTSVKDNRDTNELPSFYWANHKKQIVEEFKRRTVIGAPGNANYGNLTTHVYYSDSSGGPIKQEFRSSNGLYERQSVATTGWSAWREIEDVAGSQAKVSTAVTTLNASITTLAGQIDLKASQTSVNSLTGRMSTAETTLNLLPGQFNAVVRKDGVVASLNLSSEGLRINGNKHHITGQTLIDDAVIGTLALANGSVTNLKIGTGAVDTLQVKDGAINNAKIANLNADKINAGAIRGIDIYGAKFRSSSGTDWMEIVGGNVHLNQANGRYVKINPDGLFGYNANGSLRFKADASLVMSAALGTANSNVYLAPVSWGEARVVSYDSIPGGGAATDYTYRPIRAQSFIAPPMANAYIGTDGELRVTNAGTDGIYRDVRANGIYANFLDARGTVDHVYIRPRTANGELRITTTGSTGAYRDLRARDGAFRMIGLSTSFTGSTHFYVTTAGNGEVRFVARADTTAYRPVRASSFPTGTSLRENKTDIEAFEESALDTLRNITPYLYRIKGDEGNPYKQLGLMVDETPRYLHGESGDSMEMYALGTFALKAVKELDTKVIKIEDRLDIKDLEIQYLRQKIEQLEEKMTA